MQLSTSTNICAFQRGRERLPVEFCIDTCAKAGYEILDINLCMAMNPSSPLRTDDWESYVRHIGQYASERGIRFTQSHLPYYDVFGPGAGDKAPLMEELIRRCIIASATLGVRWAVTHPATFYAAWQDMGVSREKNIEYFEKHLKTAREWGVGIALENDFEYQPGMPQQRIYCASVYELADLCDAFRDEKHVGVCYDFGHAHLTGGFHRQNLNVLGKRLKAVHVADNHGNADEHLMPFYGTIDWKDAMAGLRDIGYQGELTYEIQEFGRYLPKDLKHLAVEQSILIGQRLIALFEGNDG
ncbi:MAG: sugar phosphate isomerase/epimerase [Clostridia bacterium]|nr:sugar phosphate isomerase/epimerase [Clostridia bacterium]